MDAGSALLPAPAVTELLIGEPTERGLQVLRSTLTRLPVAGLPTEAADQAGLMGSFLRSRGASIPIPDLLIAATAIWLDLPLLAWDADYARARAIAGGSRSRHDGAALLQRLELHPASLKP
jgi:predicted nucleic acid-binding protein